MARKPRIKVPGHAAVYHVVNRVNHKRHELDNYMKQYFLKLLSKLKQLYFVKYVGFTILNNHYHLLLNFLDPEDVDPQDAIRRWNEYHDKTPFTRNGSLLEHRMYVVRELTDVSSFMKRFNAHMTQRYNWKNGTVGTLWERRFRSSIMERGCAVALCGAYIELNAFRASLVSNPEEYEFSSLYQLSKGNPANLVDTDLISEGLFMDIYDQDELFRTYVAYIYKAGTKPHKKEKNGVVVTRAMQQTLEKYGLDVNEGSLSVRIAEFTGGKATGGEEMASEIYEDYVNPGLRGKARDIHKSKWFGGIRSGGRQLFSVCSAMMRSSP